MSSLPACFPQVYDGNAERASGIFYKALQEVPWVKVRSFLFCIYCKRKRLQCTQCMGLFEMKMLVSVYSQGLYMDAVQLFPERVQEFLDLMTEKELRLRLPMEELDILLED